MNFIDFIDLHWCWLTTPKQLASCSRLIASPLSPALTQQCCDLQCRVADKVAGFDAVFKWCMVWLCCKSSLTPSPGCCFSGVAVCL